MRLGFAASALGIGLAVFAVQRAMTQTSAQPASTTPAAAGAAAAASAAPAASDAAKHAKRTACLKDAKAKKLVGAEKSAFLKDCIAAP